jgi:hypothetical protein
MPAIEPPFLRVLVQLRHRLAGDLRARNLAAIRRVHAASLRLAKLEVPSNGAHA